MSRKKKNTTGIPDYEIDSQEHCCPPFNRSLKRRKEKESLKNGRQKDKNDN